MTPGYSVMKWCFGHRCGAPAPGDQWSLGPLITPGQFPAHFLTSEENLKTGNFSLPLKLEWSRSEWWENRRNHLQQNLDQETENSPHREKTKLFTDNNLLTLPFRHIYVVFPKTLLKNSFWVSDPTQGPDTIITLWLSGTHHSTHPARTTQH